MFSIIIVNWNGNKYLDELFESIKKQSFKDFIVYFIDNGSFENPDSIIEKYKNEIKIYTFNLSSNMGFSYAVNFGINHAMDDNSEYIITLNNDLTLDKECLAEVYAAAKKNIQYDYFQILMMNYYRPDIIDAAGIGFKKKYEAYQIGYNQDYTELQNIPSNISGACAGAAVYSKKALSAVKLNNEYFREIYFAYYEDVDLSLRLRHKKFEGYLVRNAIVYHVHSGSTGENSPFKTFYLIRNKMLCIYLNYGVQKYNSVKWFHYRLFLKKTVKDIMMLNFGNAIANIRGMVSFLILKKTLSRMV